MGHPNSDQWWERAKRLNPEAGDPTPETRAALDAFTASLNQDSALSFIGKIAAWIDDPTCPVDADTARVLGLHRTHDRNLPAVQVARQIAADRLPVVAAVERADHRRVDALTMQLDV